MAVTTTPQQIMDAAFLRSKKNTPGASASEPTELFQLTIRVVRTVYAAAARVNPFYFGTSEDVAFATTGWPMPETAESITRIEAAGSPIDIVPFDDRQAQPEDASVYFYGKEFRSAGNVNDPTSGTLTFYFSKRPDDPANKDSALDPLWTEQFNGLLIDELAIYLALKDERMAEVGQLKSDRDRELQLFVAHLEHVVPIEKRRFAPRRWFNPNAQVPLGSLFAGGTDVFAEAA